MEPELYWIPLTDEERAAVAANELVRIDIPDAETGDVKAHIVIAPRTGSTTRRERSKRRETP